MASSPDLPRGWDPRSDSLEDLVRTLFDEDGPRRDADEGAPRTGRNESVDPSQPRSAAPTERGPEPGQPRPADLELLETWGDRAVTADTVEDVFA